MEPPSNWAGLYTLDDNNDPVPCYDTLTWARWMEQGHRHIALDYDEGDPKKQIRVSTVFLGVDHSFGSGPPVLWETMVFRDDGGAIPDEIGHLTRRYTSKDAALKGHQEICQIVMAAIRASAKELPHG